MKNKFNNFQEEYNKLNDKKRQEKFTLYLKNRKDIKPTFYTSKEKLYLMDDLTKSSSHLLMCLMCYINVKNLRYFCWPGRNEIIKYAKMSPNYLSNVFKELKGKNIIRIARFRNTNLYKSGGIYFFMDLIRCKEHDKEKGDFFETHYFSAFKECFDIEYEFE